MEEDTKRIMGGMERTDREGKEMWKKKREDVLRREWEDGIQVLQKDVVKERDGRIDHEIRNHQKQETQLEQEFAMHATEQRKNLQADHDRQLACVEEEAWSKQRQLKGSTLLLEELRDGVQTYRDQIDMTGSRIEAVKGEISRMRENSALTLVLAQREEEEVPDTGIADGGIDGGADAANGSRNGPIKSSTSTSTTDQVFSLHAENQIWQRKLQVAQSQLRQTKHTAHRNWIGCAMSTMSE